MTIEILDGAIDVAGETIGRLAKVGVV